MAKRTYYGVVGSGHMRTNMAARRAMGYSALKANAKGGLRRARPGRTGFVGDPQEYARKHGGK